MRYHGKEVIMKKPYIFCHMTMAIDGRIVGEYAKTAEGRITSREYYDLAFGENSITNLKAGFPGVLLPMIILPSIRSPR